MFASDARSPRAGRATLLVRASEAGHTAVVELLLERGAHPARRDARGRTPSQMAKAAGHPEVVAVLETAHSQKKGLLDLF